jgi:DNA polymerase I-like protein with 3'-5' exonuclease and polymerase domains
MISTSFLPAETFRVRSIAPNLQNLASARTAKIYKRALGKYDHQIKSCLMALPGHVLVSPDYGKAELYGLGVLSGEDKLCDAIENGVDLHCVMAVKAFNLDIEPTERAFAESDKKHLRELAKILNFMIPYGGGWRAFQLKCWN